MSARPVLLINEDAEWYARVSRFLESHGIPMVAASTVDAAAERLAQIGQPSAVLMDIRTRHTNSHTLSALRETMCSEVPVGFVRKEAALDALLLMLTPSATAPHVSRNR
jgi:CheY-like chemotaxis protein